MRVKYPQDIVTKAFEMIDMGKTAANVGKELGIPARTVVSWRQEKKAGRIVIGEDLEEDGKIYNKTSVEVNTNDNICVVISKSLNIKTVDELIKYAKVDTKTWEIDRFVVNSWEVTARNKNNQIQTYTNFQVKVWLKRKTPSVRALESLCERLLTNRYKPKPYKYPKKKESYMLEWCPYDQHHGMLAWGQEVDADWDMRLSEEWFDLASIDVIEKSKPYNIEEVLIPIGQDFLHLNEPTGQTPGGKHQLDFDSRFGKIYESGFVSLMRAIERFRKVAPIRLLWIPGNHDPQTSFTLIHSLANNYMKPGTQEYIDGVFIDISKHARKCYVWGNSFIGFSHPITQSQFKDQRGTFADLFGKEWGTTKNHEIHCGHKHKVMEYAFMQADTHGSHTVIRMLPSLCASDKWHWDSGFLQKNRASASFIWSKTNGLEVQHITRITNKLRKLL